MPETAAPERLASPHVAARGQRTKGNAVVALAPRDNVTALMCSGLEEILPGEFETNFDRFRSAGDEEDPIKSSGRAGNQTICELLRHLRRKQASM